MKNKKSCLHKANFPALCKNLFHVVATKCENRPFRTKFWDNCFFLMQSQYFSHKTRQKRSFSLNFKRRGPVDKIDFFWPFPVPNMILVPINRKPIGEQKPKVCFLFGLLYWAYCVSSRIFENILDLHDTVSLVVFDFLC